VTTFQGRMISPGKARGEVVTVPEPLSFLGGVNGSTGEICVGKGGNVAGKILVFPKGKGSTVGSFVMYDLMVHGKQPAAVINESAETIVATGAVISSIPMVDQIPQTDVFMDGDIVTVDADAGTVDIEGVRVREVVSSALIRDGKVLLLHRPGHCHSYPGKWSLVAGKIEDGETVDLAAAREILEETGIKVGIPAARLAPVYDREGSTIWKVHPMLYRVDEDPVLNPENDSFRWVAPSEIADEECVPRTRDVTVRMMQKLRSPQFPQGSEELPAEGLGITVGPPLPPLSALRDRPEGVVRVREEPELGVQAVGVPSEVDLVRLVGLEPVLQAVEQREIAVQECRQGIAEHPRLLGERVRLGLEDVVPHPLGGVFHAPEWGCTKKRLPMTAITRT